MEHENKAYSKFISELLNYYLKKDTNTVVSPLSIWLALELLSNSTSGITKKEIDENFLCKEHIMIEPSAKRFLKIAHAFFAKDILENALKDSYLKIIKDKYNAELFHSKNVVNDVNEWINKKTDGMINEILSPNDEALFGLVNAVAFESKWQHPYDDEDIGELDFHNSDETVSKVKSLISNENYFENENATCFIKYYEDNKYAFLGVLPKNDNESLEELISKIDLVKLYKNKEYLGFADVEMPEFKIDTDITVNEYLESVGIKDLFKDGADFSPLGDLKLKIDSIRHKAVIELDQNGTKAIASTASTLVVGCLLDTLEEKKKIIVDRPYIYAIVHTRTGLPVFVGVVNSL